MDQNPLQQTSHAQNTTTDFATGIQQQTHTAQHQAEPRSEKSFVATWLFAWLLGYLAVDRFYLGKIGTGILKLITFGGLGIWVLVDIVLVLSDNARDKQGLRLKGYAENKKMAWIVTGIVFAVGLLLNLIVVPATVKRIIEANQQSLTTMNQQSSGYTTANPNVQPPEYTIVDQRDVEGGVQYYIHVKGITANTENFRGLIQSLLNDIAKKSGTSDFSAEIYSSEQLAQWRANPPTNMSEIDEANARAADEYLATYSGFDNILNYYPRNTQNLQTDTFEAKP